jgi:xanthine dehydrogenase accessory factor
MTSVLAELLASIGWRASIAEQPAMDDVDATTHVVVATQGHFDEQAIQSALATPARSIGLVASEKRATSVIEWLRENGESDEQISRVRAPVGLDLGSTDHAGMAVAILAELVQLEAGAHPAIIAIAPPEQSVDPVCGMLVDVASARWKFHHDGVEYYFCAPGCHKAFSSDPAAYL